jgi:hypothetical protein
MTITHEKVIAALFVAMSALWVVNAPAGTIKMEELEVEGDVHKPQVLFITDRSYGLPDGDGHNRLRHDFLSEVLADGRRLAQERSLRPAVVEPDSE